MKSHKVVASIMMVVALSFMTMLIKHCVDEANTSWYVVYDDGFEEPTIELRNSLARENVNEKDKTVGTFSDITRLYKEAIRVRYGKKCYFKLVTDAREQKRFEEYQKEEMYKTHTKQYIDSLPEECK